MTIFLAILRSAALLVPRPERMEWLAEWTSELWYVLQSRHREEAMRFCLGAFKDAMWLRRNSPSSKTRQLPWLQSPIRCILCMAALAAISVFFAFRLPGPRDTILPSPYRDARHLVMISTDGHLAESVPTVSIGQYRALSKRMFTGVAFYQPTLTRVRTARNQTAELPVALASANLFELLGIPVSSNGRSPAKLVLSEAAWRKYFDSDPRILGRVLDMAGQQASVVGVIPARSWRLPGRVEAWLLEDEPALAALPSNAKGFVLGRGRKPAYRISVPNRRGGYDAFKCVSLVQGAPILAWFMLIPLALLILPATTSLALGEYPANADSPARATRFRRWIFLGMKFALILPIVFCGTLDLAPIITSAGIQPHATFVGYVLAFRWALIDQRQRCPVCLRSLSDPVRIGQASGTFLEWYGTELVCAKGHGLLHVPEMPSSYSTQRWLYLDPSWSSLFF